MIDRYFSHSKKYSSVNGKVTEDLSESVTFENNKGRRIKKKNGKTIESIVLDKNDFDKYLKNIDKDLQVSASMFNTAYHIMLDILDLGDSKSKEKSSIDSPHKTYRVPQDLTPASKLKRSRLSNKQKSICFDIIKEFGLDPKTATKKEIKEIYDYLYKELDNKCKSHNKASKEHRECLNKLKLLSKNIEAYNNPNNKCY